MSQNDKVANLIAIKRTHLGIGRKLKFNLIELHEVKLWNSNDMYDMTWVGMLGHTIRIRVVWVSIMYMILCYFGV